MDFKLSALDRHGRLSVEVEFSSFVQAMEHMKRISNTSDPLAQAHALILRREIWPQDVGCVAGSIWSWDFTVETFVQLF